jgi:hypothetical protein
MKMGNEHVPRPQSQGRLMLSENFRDEETLLGRTKASLLPRMVPDETALAARVLLLTVTAFLVGALRRDEGCSYPSFTAQPRAHC